VIGSVWPNQPYTAVRSKTGSVDEANDAITLAEPHAISRAEP
jgi:hypothetical protein